MVYIRLIMEALDGREIYSEWKWKIVKDKISEECPQEAIMSLLLKNLVADDLLRKLDRELIFTVRYSFDFSIRGYYTK